MGEIAAERTINARIDDSPLRFAIMHLADMLIALEKEYDARWHDEMRDEAPAPISPEAESPTAGGPCPPAAAVNTRPAGSRWRAYASTIR